jgi:hypothetical protein
MNQIKNQLYDEYKKYLINYHDKIVDILIIEGKKEMGNDVKTEDLSFENFIYSENYFLTTFDLWLLVTKYKIPTIFISQKWILQTKYEKHEFLGYGNEDDKFAFIVIPGFRPENVPGYKLIVADDGDVFISLNKLDKECVEGIRQSIRHKVSIEDYLYSFTKPLTTNYEKKNPNRLVIESNSEEIKPEKKKKLIIEETTPLSNEEIIIEPKKKQSRKKVIIRGTKNKSVKRNQKKRRLLIVDSTDTEKV